MTPNEKRKTFSEGIIEKEKRLQEEMKNALGEPEAVFKILTERFNLYQTAEDFPMTEMDRALISSMKNDVAIETTIYHTKQEFAEQLSNIITRLESIETELKALKNKQNTT